MTSASSRTTRRSKVVTRSSLTQKTDRTSKNVSSRSRSLELSLLSKCTKSHDSTFKASWITFGKTWMKKLVKSKQRSKVQLMSLLVPTTLTIPTKPMDPWSKEGPKHHERNKACDSRRSLRLISWNCQRTLSITTSKNASVSSSVNSKRHRIKARKMSFETISRHKIKIELK